MKDLFGNEVVEKPKEITDTERLDWLETYNVVKYSPNCPSWLTELCLHEGTLRQQIDKHINHEAISDEV